MGRKKKAKPAPKRFSSWWLVVCILLASAAFALVRFAGRARVDVPDADRSIMEPQVAEKIQGRREAVFRDPESGESWGELGVVFQAHGLAEEASRCYREAIELEPNELRWQFLLVHALRAFDREQALAESARAIELGQSYAPIYVVRAELLGGENVDEAKSLYEKTLQLDPKNAMAFLGLGQMAMSAGELEEARRYLERARDESPDAGSVHALLARVYQRLGESELATGEAELAFRNTEPVGIEDPIHFRMIQESVASTAQLDRAKAAEDAGNYDAAETTYRDLVRLRPDDADIRSRLADVLARQGRREEAEEHYRATLAIKPDHAGALYGLGTVLSLAGRYDEAERCYRKALEVRPEHGSTLSNLAGILAFQGNVDEALSLYQKGLEVEPENVAIHRGLAELYFREGRYSEAIPHFRAVLQEKPDLGPVHMQLGAALLMSGDSRQARTHLARAQALGEKVPPELASAVAR